VPSGAERSGRRKRRLIEIVKCRFLRGPNLYRDRSAVVGTLRGGAEFELLGQPAPPGVGALAGCAALDDGTDVLTLIEEARTGLAQEADGWALVLAIAERAQASFAFVPARGKVVDRSECEITLVVPADSAPVGIAALELAVALVIEMGKAPGQANYQRTIQGRSRFVTIARVYSLDQLTLGIARRATELDIPVYFLSPQGSIVQLGQGRFGRLMRETVLDPQPGHATLLARDKWITLGRLRAFGLPALPSGRVTSADQAVALANKIGGPVVVKPAAGGQGVGISLRLTEEADILQAFATATKYGRNVIVEKYAPGADFRLLVVGGRLLAAVERLPAKVYGDGHSTVRQLIDALNTDPLRGPKFEKLLDRVRIDERTDGLLARQGFALDSVPPAGAQVIVTSTSNFSQGGTTIDVTGVVHPDNRVAAETAARSCRALVAGVDFISQDISRSWRDGDSWILEVNTSPCLRPHWVANPAQDVTTPVVRVAFPEGAPARVPIAAVTGSIGMTTTCEMVAQIARAAGRHPALNTTQGTWSGEAQLRIGDYASGVFTADLLTDPAVDMAIVELTPEALIEAGMGLDALDVAAVHNRNAGFGEELALVQGIVVRHARQWVLLHADDPSVLVLGEGMAPGARLGLVSADPDSAVLARHRRAGGYTVTAEGRGESPKIVIRQGEEIELSLNLSAVPAAEEEAPQATLENRMFAAAIALKIGLPAEAVVAGLGGNPG
jgi:cyanophycin synthetase